MEMLRRPEQNGPEQAGLPAVCGSNRRLLVAHVGKTNAEMETKALNTATKKKLYASSVYP